MTAKKIILTGGGCTIGTFIGLFIVGESWTVIFVSSWQVLFSMSLVAWMAWRE